jgi:hypothetical protein
MQEWLRIKQEETEEVEIQDIEETRRICQETMNTTAEEICTWTTKKQSTHNGGMK